MGCTCGLSDELRIVEKHVASAREQGKPKREHPKPEALFRCVPQSRCKDQIRCQGRVSKKRNEGKKMCVHPLFRGCVDAQSVRSQRVIKIGLVTPNASTPPSSSTHTQKGTNTTSGTPRVGKGWIKASGFKRIPHTTPIKGMLHKRVGLAAPNTPTISSGKLLAKERQLPIEPASASGAWNH